MFKSNPPTTTEMEDDNSPTESKNKRLKSNSHTETSWRRKLTSKLRNLPGANSKRWNQLSYLVKIPVALVPPTAAWATIYWWNPKTGPSSLLAAYGRSVGLLGLKDIFDELKKNLGVRLTIPRTFLVFSTLGYTLSTVAELKFLQGGVGRVFFIFNVLFAAVHSYMLYLTAVYNSKLEDASRTFERSFAKNEAKRHTVSIPALSTWVIVCVATSLVWVNEGVTSFRASFFKNEILAALGFLLTSLGTVRSGWKASMSSSPEITPFAGALTMGLASTLSAASLVPLWAASPIARIYLTGYLCVMYSVFLNAFYAWKQERKDSKRRPAKARIVPSATSGQIAAISRARL